MTKKKSDINRLNMLKELHARANDIQVSEGFFDWLKKAIKKGRLKRNKKLDNLIVHMNKDTEEFENLYNDLMKKENPNHKDIKLTKKNIDDFV